MWPVDIVEIRITGESDRDRDIHPQKYFASATWNTMALKITITSTKGGVGKTTLRALTVRAGYLLGARQSVEVNIPAFIREHYHPDCSSSEAI